MSNVVITLPFPVPLYDLFRNAKGPGRAKTKRYETWRRAAGWDLERQKPPSVTGPVALEIAIGKPLNKNGTENKRKRDLSNLVKGVEDILVDHGVIQDDSLIHDLRVRWAAPCEHVEGTRVSIERMNA
jgi:Holliday junction resolvase RusA-like endonuclease